MTLNEYIISNELSSSEKDDLSFRLVTFLNKVFSSSFAKELENIYKTVDIVEKNRKDDVIAMTYPISKRIALNTHVFYALPIEEQMAFLAHELIHHKQNIEGKLTKEKCSDKITESDVTIPFEEEAYLQGNMAFRKWTEIYNN